MTSTTNVDLTNCDREPIHLLGAIQPIGFLLTLTIDWNVARASENVADFLGETNDSFIGRPLDDIFLSKAVHDLRNRLATLRGPNSVDKIFDLKLTDRAGPFDVAIHMANGQIVIEAQPAAVKQGDSTSMV